MRDIIELYEMIKELEERVTTLEGDQDDDELGEETDEEELDIKDSNAAEKLNEVPL